MNKEYKALRAEMLKWQDRRFEFLKISISVITGLLCLKLVIESPSQADTWPLVSSVLLLYLSGANQLTWYAGIANAKLGAYIKVFYESGARTDSDYRWEGRLHELKDWELDPHNVNIWISIVYLALGIVSVAIPLATANSAGSGPWVGTILPVAVVLFVSSLILVARFSYPRDRYEKRWTGIKNGENGKANV